MEMHTKRGPRSANDIRNEPFRCTECGWTGPSSERIWAHYSGSGLSLRGFICPKCYKKTTERVGLLDEDEASNE